MVLTLIYQQLLKPCFFQLTPSGLIHALVTMSSIRQSDPDIVLSNPIKIRGLIFICIMQFLFPHKDQLPHTYLED